MYAPISKVHQHYSRLKSAHKFIKTSSLKADMQHTFDNFMSPILEALADGKEHTSKELFDYSSKALGLTSDDLAEKLSSGASRAFDRFSWGKTYLRKAKLIDKGSQRNLIKITERGKDFLKTHPKNTPITVKDLTPFREFMEFWKPSSPTPAPRPPKPIVSLTPEDQIEEAMERLNGELSEVVLDKIKKNSPAFFEDLVLRLLVKMGYGGTFEDAAVVTKQTRDEGIDGVIKEDPLGLDKIYVQAKRWDKKVGRVEIQNFVGALSGKGASKGVFITTGVFTQDARSFQPSSGIKIILIDGKELCDYMIKLNLGVTVKATHHIKKIDTDFFQEEGEEE